MHLRKLLIVMSVLALPGLLLAQEKAAVFEFEGIGVEQSTIMAATQIFRNELGATGKFTVLSKGDMEAKLAAGGVTDYTCNDVNCAAANGFTMSVEEVVIGSLTRLGERITADVRLVSVIKKEVVFSDRFSATSVDDLDMTLRKLAEAVASRKKIESELGRYAITEEETMEQRRKKSYITSGASFGFGFPLGDSYAGVNSLYTLAWVVRYEAGNFVLDNSIGYTWGSGEPDSTDWGFQFDKVSVGILPWDMGLRYIFSRGSDFTPFVGGGIGLHFVGSQDLEGGARIDNGTAMAIHLAGGVYGFQSYDFRFTLEAKYTMLFTDVFGEISGSTSHQLGISIGISRKLEKGEKRGCMCM